MKILSKIVKTVCIMFMLVVLFTLYGCDTTTPQTNQLDTPSFTTVTKDKNVVVFIETVFNADDYYIYVYQDDSIKNKFNVTPEEAIMGYSVYLGYGEFELAVQAISDSTSYSDSLISNHKVITLTETIKPHEHVFVDGTCSCGEVDPNYNVPNVFSISYILNDGVLPSDAPRSYTEGETVFLVEATKDNYEFDGWYLKSDFSGESISVISNKTTGDITLYAKWKSNDVEYTGYYANANDLVGTSLKKVLRTIISTGVNATSYNDLKSKLPYTDASLTDSSKMKLLYSNHLVNAKWDDTATWNREHVWPKSKGWFENSGAGSDIHHIRPENTNVNSVRGNLAFGEVSNGSAVKCCGEIIAYKNNSYFEPFDEFKGDCARIIFYVLVRYSQSDSYNITNVAQSMQMLLEWHEADPVDEFELQRNERCYSVQKNRNPFIDHPEFADMIWG